MRLRTRARSSGPGRDRIASATGALIFASALGMASVALPLLALRSGYSPVQVGLLVGSSAATQLAARMGMGSWMRRFPDWTFVVAAALLLAVANFLAAFTTALVPFALAHLLQGVARAFFWTGSQTHVVRGNHAAVGALAVVNLASAAGLLIGPLLAGIIGGWSLPAAMVLAALLATAACVPALMLDRLPPFSPPSDRVPGRIWRRPGVDAGCWAGVSAGAWRGLLSSYVPVALEAARHTALTIGVLVSVANLAQLVGSGAVSRLRREGVVRVFAGGVLAAGVGTAAVGLLSPNQVLAGFALALSGLGAGAIQTVGPAVATEAVHPEERGEAIAAIGAFRAAALFASPLGAAAVVSVAPVAVALVLGGALIALPAAFARNLASHVRADTDGGPPV